MHATGTETSLTCRAIAFAASNEIYSLKFELTNLGTATVELAFHEPFTTFSIEGTAGGRPVTAHQPALDISVREATLSVPSTITLSTPIRLHLSEDALPGANGFVWTVPYSSSAVSLQVRLQFAGRLDVVGPLTFA